MSKEEIEIKECWWKGSDFHVKTVDDRHLVFKNCVLRTRSETTPINQPEGVTVQEWKFQAQTKLESVKDEPSGDGM